MDQAMLQSTPSHRERWLALLDKYCVGHAKALHVVEVRGMCDLPLRFRGDFCQTSIWMDRGSKGNQDARVPVQVEYVRSTTDGCTRGTCCGRRSRSSGGHVFTAIGISLWQDCHKFRFSWCGFLGFQTSEPEIEPAALESQIDTDERSIRTWTSLTACWNWASAERRAKLRFCFPANP
jgi:hypothetical protein